MVDTDLAELNMGLSAPMTLLGICHSRLGDLHAERTIDFVLPSATQVPPRT